MGYNGLDGLGLRLSLVIMGYHGLSKLGIDIVLLRTTNTSAFIYVVIYTTKYS